MEEVWRQSPAPALRFWGEASRVEANAALTAWSRSQRVSEADWLALAQTCLRAGPGQTPLPLTMGPLASAVNCQPVPLADGLLLWLSPVAPARAEPVDRLGLLQAFGRVGLYVRDLRDDSAHWDRHMFELVGLPPAEQAPGWGEFLQQVVHPDDRAMLHQAFSDASRRVGRGDVHFRILGPGGEERHVHSLYEVQAGPDGQAQAMVGVLVDDTVAGRRASQREASRRSLAVALDMAGVSVWHIDLASRRVLFNHIGLALLGLPADAQGVPIEQVRARLHEDDLQAMIEAEAQAVGSDRVIDVLARYATADGSWRWLLTRRVAERDAQGQAVALRGISVDVHDLQTERARTQALAERAKLVAQSLGLGFWVNEPDGAGRDWDAQMYTLYDRDPALPPPAPDEWLDQHVHAADREAIRQRVHQDRDAWAPHTRFTLRVMTADGSERWVQAWTRRWRRADGQRVAMGVHADITAQHRLEEAEAEAERSARASRDKSAFMALMSHRLRTPLNAVLGFAQLMSQDPAEALGARQRERLQRIDAAGHDLLAMLDDVFDLASLDGDMAAPVPVALSNLLSQAMEAVMPLARQRGVALRLEQPQELQLSTDRRLLARALSHLILRSVRRCQSAGQVLLRAEPDGEPGWCRLTLSDSGPPVSTPQRELLFERSLPDAVARPDGELMIGLNLVREVIERLGGHIEAWRGDTQGDGFMLRLPLASERRASPPAADGLRLLCIEDNPVNLMLVRELVAQRPAIQLGCATDGLSGLAAAAEQRPHAILLDLQLPDISGVEVLARLRQNADMAACKVIALSANALPEDMRRARELGFDEYWTKPIDFDRFLDGLDRLIAEH